MASPPGRLRTQTIGTNPSACVTVREVSTTIASGLLTGWGTNQVSACASHTRMNQWSVAIMSAAMA